VHFLDSGRLFAADGPSTSPNAANPLPPMSVPLFFSSIPPPCVRNSGANHPWAKSFHVLRPHLGPIDMADTGFASEPAQACTTPHQLTAISGRSIAGCGLSQPSLLNASHGSCITRASRWYSAYRSR
jgi:hypothetical protein